MIQVAGGGEQWTFAQLAQCPTLEKTLVGDGPISWSAPFVQYRDHLPPRHAVVTVEDGRGIFQRGRIIHRAPPDTAHCDAAPAQYVAEGGAAKLGDRKFQDLITYGPVWDGTSLALTVGGAVQHAFGFGGATLQYDGDNPDPASTFELVASEQFAGRPTQDVLNWSTAISAGSATPYVWSVRNDVFRWGPLDLTPRYEVLCADGAVVAPSDACERIATQILVLWGQGQIAVAPTTIDYTHLPTIVDLVVNAGTEVHDALTAQRLADGLHARLNYIELGWSSRVTVPAGTEIRALFPPAPVAVAPWRVPAGAFLRVPDYNHVGRYGPHHPVPEAQLMTSARWDGKTWQAQCGTLPPDIGAVVRSTLYAGNSRTVHVLAQPGLSASTRDANKTPLVGPPIPAPASGQPPPIDNAIPPVATAKNQTLITHEAPKPVKPMIVVQDVDVFAAGQGEVLASGFLDTAKHRVDLPPCELDSVLFTISPLGSLTLEVWTAKRDPSSDDRGQYTITAGEFTPDFKLLTVAVTSDKIYQHKYLGPPSDPLPRVEKETQLLFKITGTPVAATSFHFSATGNRIVPGHPAGHDTAPALGARST